MKMIITKLEQEIGKISKENDKLLDENSGHEVFESHLLRHYSTSPIVQQYQVESVDFDEPDSSEGHELEVSIKP